MPVEQLALAISVIALVVSSLTAWRQLVRAQHANALPVLVDMFREFRDPELVEARSFVLGPKFKQVLEDQPPSKGFPPVGTEAGDKIRRISHFFDNLGVLLRYGVVDHDMTLGFLGISAEEVWKKLEAYIVSERNIRQQTYGRPPYQVYFEHLVARSRVRKPEKAFEGLSRV